ncbi:MAG: hypothetical protein ACOYOB_17555 [Myxococcota bacterium]
MKPRNTLPALLISVFALTGCEADDNTTTDVPTSPITACADFDVAGLTSDNVETYVAKYQSHICKGLLVGGNGGLLQECGFGGDLLVCGQSAGLKVFGCSCYQGKLNCTNGLKVKEGLEQQCADVSDVTDGDQGDAANVEVDVPVEEVTEVNDVPDVSDTEVVDPNCHYDCIPGYQKCENGVVTVGASAAIPCEYWKGVCPSTSFSCPFGCKVEGEYLTDGKQYGNPVDMCAPCTDTALYGDKCDMCLGGPGSTGCPCASDAECKAGSCVDTLVGARCGGLCSDGCPSAFKCATVIELSRDAKNICVSMYGKLCKGCVTTADCQIPGSQSATCISQGGGTFCGSACTIGDECPTGYVCSEVPDVAGAKSKQCVVKDGGTCGT